MKRRYIAWWILMVQLTACTPVTPITPPEKETAKIQHLSKKPEVIVSHIDRAIQNPSTFSPNLEQRDYSPEGKGTYSELLDEYIVGEQNVEHQQDIDSIPDIILSTTTQHVDPQLIRIDPPASFTTQSLPEPEMRIIYLHGSNQEDAVDSMYRSTQFFDYLYSHTPHEILDRIVTYAIPYESDNDVFDNALQFTNLIQSDTEHANLPYIIIAHSRGGLVARIMYALQHASGNPQGIITLGTPHHGSPLAVPALMHAAFNQLSHPLIKKAIYLKSMFDKDLISKVNIRKAVESFGEDLLTIGGRNLFYQDMYPYYPESLEIYHGLLGIGALTLTPHNRFGTLCSNSLIYDYPGITNIETANRFGSCHYNTTQAIQEFERLKGVSEPYIFAHAGYLSDVASVVKEKNAFYKAASTKLSAFLANKLHMDKELQASTSKDAEHAGLSWLNAHFWFIPSKESVQGEFSGYSANDGLVTVDSACNTDGNSTIATFDPSTQSISIDYSQLERSRGALTLKCTPHRDCDHTCIVEGQYQKAVDPLFESIIQEIQYFIRQHDSKYTSTKTSTGDTTNKETERGEEPQEISTEYDALATYTIEQMMVLEDYLWHRAMEEVLDAKGYLGHATGSNISGAEARINIREAHPYPKDPTEPLASKNFNVIFKLVNIKRQIWETVSITEVD